MKVAEVQDDAQIMGILGEDPAWAAYAITDLDPPYRRHAGYVGAWDGGRLAALALVYAPPGFTSLLPFGENAGVEAIVRATGRTPERAFLIVSEAHRDIVERHYRLDVWPMFRMVVGPEELIAPPPAGAEVRRLGKNDLDATIALYRHWESTFFQPELLKHGLYAGAFVDGVLVGVAGTHTLSSRYRIGTVGGVFTHPDFRGRGIARATTGMVAAALREAGMGLIALNVRQDNSPAIAAYTRLGFRVHMPYWEGHAKRRARQ